VRTMPTWMAIVLTAAGSTSFAVAGDAFGSALLAALFGAAVWHAITGPHIELLQHALEAERELNASAPAEALAGSHKNIGAEAGAEVSKC
jgi:cation transporter-like permease